MTTLIIVSAVLFVLTLLIQGFNLATITALIATVLFCSRKAGYFCNIKTVCTLESLGLFVTITMQLLLHRFDIVECIIIIILRAVFIGIVVYDETQFVYEHREERRDGVK